MFKEFWKRLRYRIERLFVRETCGQRIMLATLIGLGAQLFGLFSKLNLDVASIPRNIDNGLRDALWWTLQRGLYLSRLETGFGGTEAIMIYAVFLTLFSMAVFATVLPLVTIVTINIVKPVRKGDTSVKKRRHAAVSQRPGYALNITEISAGSIRPDRNMTDLQGTAQ